MNHSETDFSKKIRYAEDWLQKAKREINKGSSVTAGNHIILAIAEMENLKRTIFQLSEPIQLPKRQKSYSWLGWRPFFALTLLVFAFGLFSYTLSNMSNSPITSTFATDSHMESISEQFMNKDRLLASKIEPEIKIPIMETVNVEPDVVPSPQVAELPKTPAASSKKRTTPRRSSPDNSPAIIPVIAETPSVIEEQPLFSDVSLPVVDESDLVLEAIQLETIIAARESLSQQ